MAEGAEQGPMTFEQYRRLALYEAGVSLADIGDMEGVTAPTIFARLKRETPRDYKRAKDALAKARNAKYRRVGALAADLQIKTLEYYHQVLDDENVSEEDKKEVRRRLKDISIVGETAERRADLNEGKVTDRVETVEKPMTAQEWREFLQQVHDAGTGLDTTST